MLVSRPYGGHPGINTLLTRRAPSGMQFLYAPDLNPWDEGGWHHLKNVEMGNMVCHDLEELHEQFRFAVARIRRRPRLVHSIVAQAGLTIEKTCPSLRSGQ
jgi:hypothetical protein